MMNCESALDIVTGTAEPAGPEERIEAERHVRECGDCTRAFEAIGMLGLERSVVLSEPPPGAFERAVRAAVAAGRQTSPRRWTFAGGMAAGAALAASIVLAVVFFAGTPASGPGAVNPDAVATPRLRLAANETRNVSFSLDTGTPMTGATIHVLVDGDIALDGYAGERELRWTTDLEPGSNQLTIPVVALGGGGGQLLVEVEHDQRQRRFLVDIDGIG